MHKNQIWLFLLIAVGIATAWYSGKAVYHLYSYYRLQNHTEATVTDWKVKEIKSDAFVLEATYFFRLKGEEILATDFLIDPIFRNHYAAEQSIPKFAKKSWIVWFDPTNPHYSSLQKKFPTKECWSAGMMLALATYFTWLGFYVGSKHESR